MNDLVAHLSQLIVGLLGTIGPVALLLMYMNVRDRRESLLFTAVILELNRPHLRGYFTVRVRSWPLFAETVWIRLWDCSREQTWNVIESISAKLPPDTRIEVNGITDCRAKSTWKLTVTRGVPSASACPAQST